jgi:hypothetical protein
MGIEIWTALAVGAGSATVMMFNAVARSRTRDKTYVTRPAVVRIGMERRRQRM